MDTVAETGSVGTVETQYFTFAAPPDAMPLDSGGSLGPITIAYETYGTLNENKSNAILITHALSGDAHVAGYHSAEDRKPGWWNAMVGPGKGFDTEKYFVICSNVIGGCRGSTGPSSTNPETGAPYGLDFPIITIGDMVRAQARLVDHLGIDALLSVAGGSMGGMQVLEWATRYPERVRSAMVIASSYYNDAQAIAFNAVGRHAIQGDHAFREGGYYGEGGPSEGLAVARMMAHITYLSQEAMHTKFGRALYADERYRYDFKSEFSVETYLDHQGQQFVNRFDANSYLYITKAIDYFDLAAAYGSLDEAMARVTGKTLVLSYSSDWLYPPGESRRIVDALTRQGKEVTYCNIRSDYGHDAFLLEVDVMTKLIAGFLENVSGPGKACAQRADCPCAKSVPPVGQAGQPSVYKGPRADFDCIWDLVEPGSAVLDVGCGDGVLLCKLLTRKRVRGLGVELDQNNIVACVQCGIPVIQADIDQGLSGLPDRSFDYAILSMTLQEVQNPEAVIREMLRVATTCIVSFPNFAHWRNRASMAFHGRSPVSRNLPYRWYETPNRHFLSIADFREFCATNGIRILDEIPLSSHRSEAGAARIWPNLCADEAVFVVRL